jgi:hypothetical protein
VEYLREGSNPQMPRSSNQTTVLLFLLRNLAQWKIYVYINQKDKYTEKSLKLPAHLANNQDLSGFGTISPSKHVIV